MKAPAALILMTLLLTLGGCIPNVVTYYRPTVEGGQLHTPTCVPTKSIIDFNVQAGRASLPVRAIANDGKHVHQIALFFSKGSWKSFHFSSIDFRIYDVDTHQTLQPSSVRAFSETGYGPLTTEPYSVKQGNAPVRFHIQITLPKGLPAHFRLLSPPIVIDGEQTPFPAIEFERKAWTGISPFNC